jgi:hypothetical protein
MVAGPSGLYHPMCIKHASCCSSVNKDVLLLIQPDMQRMACMHAIY